MKKAKKVKRQPYYCELRGSWIIPLTQGRETLVDADDVEFLGQFNWKWNPCKTVFGYAELSSGIYMHRYLSKCSVGYMSDHINGNSLDNRKSNLRTVTSRENSQNKKIHRSGKMLGCYYNKPSKKWQARICIEGTKKSLGYFKTEHEGHQAYMKAYNELITKERSAA